jgi:hypothetical protein
MKNQSADTIKAVLDFNEIVKRDVKKEAQRDWGDLIRG